MPVGYAFGWSPSLPDIRDGIYAFTPSRATLASLPASVNLDSPSPGAPFDPVFAQGELGSCGPNAIGGDILFALMILQGIKASPVPSRLFIYYNCRVLMGTVNDDSGVDNRTLLKSLVQYGWCDESLWPYDVSKFRMKPPAACYAQAADRKLIEYNSVAQDLPTMKGCLAAGDPFLFGFTVFRSMLTPAVDATGVVPMPTMRDSVAGGHDVLFVGYDDSKQAFRFRNSWGAEWGDSGYGWMPYGYVNPRLSGDYWTVKKSPWPGPVPPPPPPPIGTGVVSVDTVARIVTAPQGWTLKTQ